MSTLRKLSQPEAVDVMVDGSSTAVVIDGYTVVTMVSVWGKPFMPTLLHPQFAETPNTLPITIIAEQMRQHGLGVDVDVICEGRRTTRDNYADLYQTFLGGRSAAGQRSTTLVIRLDTRAGDTAAGLLWRRDSVRAVIAATRRVARALNQANCRARVLTASQMRDATANGFGGTEAAASTYREGWTRLARTGNGYVTSYFFSPKDIVAAHLDAVWSYPAEHTALVVCLRRSASGITAAAMVRVSTPQPLAASPAVSLNRLTGRQWSALTDTVAGARRLCLPSTVVTDDLDKAVVVGPSGVLMGKFGDSMLLMPLSDPAAPTRIGLRADSDKAVRQLIRRCAAVSERVAVYDPAGRWAMTARSPRIWNTRDMTAQPPQPATMVVHYGSTNPYPGAWTSVAVGADVDTDDRRDIVIEQIRDRIRLQTRRFRTEMSPVTFRNEEAFLN